MHIEFNELPLPVRTAVQQRTGTIDRAHTLEAGANSVVAAILETEGAGSVFLKAVPEGHPAIRDQQREARVSPYTTEVGPHLLWHEMLAGWDVMAFAAIQDARHADYSPGSSDLPKLSHALDTLAETPCPPVAMMSAARRWAPYLTSLDDQEHLSVESLLHTDYNPGNVLVTDRRAWLVDWAWATRGAGFIDLGCLIPRLIAAGHDPWEAEAWAARHQAWQDAHLRAPSTCSPEPCPPMAARTSPTSTL